MSVGVPEPHVWLEALRTSGCHLSDVQEVLVRIFAHANSPLSAEQVWGYARQIRPETGRATAYRVVDKLESLGLLRRVHGYLGCSHFLPALPEPSILFVCRVCGRADYLDWQPLDWLVRQVQRTSSHHISESRLQLFGTCVVCIRSDNYQEEDGEE